MYTQKITCKKIKLGTIMKLRTPDLKERKYKIEREKKRKKKRANEKQKTKRKKKEMKVKRKCQNE